VGSRGEGPRLPWWGDGGPLWPDVAPRRAPGASPRQRGQDARATALCRRRRAGASQAATGGEGAKPGGRSGGPDSRREAQSKTRARPDEAAGRSQDDTTAATRPARTTDRSGGRQGLPGGTQPTRATKRAGASEACACPMSERAKRARRACIARVDPPRGSVVPGPARSRGIRHRYGTRGSLIFKLRES